MNTLVAATDASQNIFQQVIDAAIPIAATSSTGSS